MYAVTQQQDVPTDSRRYVERATTDAEVATLSEQLGVQVEPSEVIIFHRTVEGAEAAAVRYATAQGMPEGEDVSWCGVGVHQVERYPYLYVVQD